MKPAVETTRRDDPDPGQASAGDSQVRAALEQKTRALRMADWVIFIGNIGSVLDVAPH